MSLKDDDEGEIFFPSKQNLTVKILMASSYSNASRESKSFEGCFYIKLVLCCWKGFYDVYVRFITLNLA